ncbi:E3 SUMO-protein ligase RanBP2 [Mactra antiquata]
MFKTKRDVDRHVSHILNRIREEKERNARGYQFAKLYYGIGDYESAKRFLQAFLSVRDTVPQAHTLMGQVYEGLRMKEKAIESYKRSLDLESDQKDIILKVCDLYCDASVTVNADVARIWIERAERFFPNSHTVFKLKERLVDKDGTGCMDEVKQLVSEELIKNPSDVKLHIKLLHLNLDSNDIEEAYKHAVATDRTLAFVSSLEWYECLADVLQMYEDEGSRSDEMTLQIYKLYTMSSLTSLYLQSENRDLSLAVKSLKQLDEYLKQYSNTGGQNAEFENFLTEMKGQVFYLSGVLLLKKALKGLITWKEASSFSTVCFILSDIQKTINVKSSGNNQVKPEWKKFYDYIYAIGCDRLSQGGHMIYALLKKQDVSQYLKKLQQNLCTPQGKTTLVGFIFSGIEKKKDNSFILQSDLFTRFNLDIPAKSSLQQYDSVAYNLHSGDLNRLIWLSLQYYNSKDKSQPDYEQIFSCVLFPDMKYSMSDLSSGDPGTLSQLDIQVFLYTCVYWASVQHKNQKRNIHSISDKPDVLPTCLSSSLCNKQQCEWWSAVYSMEKKTRREKISKLWGVVMRGLESVRLVIPNALSLSLIVHVAVSMETRAQEIESLDAEGIVTPKLAGMQSRAAFYWKAASDCLDRIDRNQNMGTPKELMFPMDTMMDPAAVKQIREQVKFAMATIDMKEERNEEALNVFETLHQPEAAYYSGLIYRKLAEAQDMNANSSSSSSHNTKQIALLSKSKSAMYQAIDRLETDKNEELKDSVRRDLDEVVCKLISLESGGPLMDSILSNTSQNYGSPESVTDSEDEEPSKFVTPRTPTTQKHLNTAPSISPTRVEIQLRALEATNTALTSRVVALEETMKIFSNQLVQLFQAREENKTLREQLQLMSLQGLSGMSMVRPPTTPQQPAPRMNHINMSFGATGSVYDFPGQGSLPPHMAQYCYSANSPRPGSAYGQPTYEDFNNVDGEFYDPDGEDFYPSDQNLVQEWPFGHKAGVEGKSTITYSPQPSAQQSQVRGMNPANAGMFANALRGPSIQYGASCYPSLAPLQQPPAPSQLPGPGYFAHSSQPAQPAGVPPQPGMVQGQFGMAQNTSTIPIASQVPQPKPGMMPPLVTKPMMPPNAVISNQSNESAIPTLIPGSVGVPASTTSVSTSASNVPKSVSNVVPSPASASSILSNIAAKHQEEKKASDIAQKSATTPQKTVFGGFSFTSTPKITQPTADNKEDKPAVSTTTSSAAPVKPFSGFTLTPPKSSSSESVATTTSKPQSSTGGLFGSTPNQTFGSLAAQGQTAAGFKGGDQKGFPGFGTAPLFGKSPSPRRRVTSGGSDDHIEEYEPNVDFKPVIQLPDLIEVKTGEEEDEILFCERAKLFRFDTDANQWKERGIGNMKISRNKSNKSVRILMRREQVLKVCANHKISPDMKLTQMSSSDRAWVWNAMDYADGEIKAEKFAIKFKTVDIAEKFKKAFEGSQTEMTAKHDQKETTERKADEGSVKDKSSDKDDKKSDLSSLFKPKPGAWTCDGCYVQNTSDCMKCPCCASLKPGVKAEDVTPEKPPPPAPVLGSFGSGGGFSFSAPATDKPAPSGGFSFGGNQQKPTTATNEPSGSGFKFGSSDQSSSASGSASTGSGSGFKFGSPATSVSSSTPSGFTFGTPTKTVSSSTPASGFKFGTPSTTVASSGIPASSTSTSQSSSGFVFGNPSTSATTSKPASGFQFGTPTTATSTNNLSSTNKPDSTTGKGFSFGASTPGNTEPSSIFGGQKASAVSGSSGFTFGNANVQEKPVSTPDVTSSTANEADSNNKLSESLLAKYLSSDNWTCGSCHVNNDGVTDKCVSCKAIHSESKPAASSPFSFGQTSKPSEESPFGTPKSGSAGFKFTFAPTSNDQKPQPAASLGSGFNFSKSMSPFSIQQKSPLKSPQATKSGSVASPKSPDGQDEGFYMNKEGDDSHIHFEPVIELPDEVEIKTGEEEEHVIFSHRAKLFRFNKGEWKERGLGDVKVLFNAETNKARIVMRREHILKLCCNHYIFPDLSFKPMPNSNGRALVWFAMDFADGETKSEQFSIRFKTEDIAKDFESAVATAQSVIKGTLTIDQAMKKCAATSGTVEVETIGATSQDVSKASGASSSDDVIIVKVDEATPEEIRKARELMLPDHFYLYQRKEPCPGCRGCQDELPIFERLGANVSGDAQVYDDDNDDEDDDDDYEDVDDDEDDDEDDDDNTQDYIEEKKGDENETENTSSGIMFGGSSVSQFSFASIAAGSGIGSFQTDSSKPFQFQGAGKQLFGGIGDDGNQSTERDDEVVQGEDPQFEPVVPLPELIDVKTGEEDEIPVFSNRAKLFRFDKDSNQWKEKGIGDMKILKHKEMNKYRLLLRREQVHKLACNHLLTSDIKMTRMATSETSWCWIAQDYADGEAKIEQLAVKFKTIDLAETFKSKVDEILSNVKD